MPTNILSTLMGSAQQAASSAMDASSRGNGRNQRDPEQEAFKQILENYAKSGDIEAIDRMQAHADNFGMGKLVPALVDAMGGQARLDQVRAERDQLKGIQNIGYSLLTGQPLPDSASVQQPSSVPNSPTTTSGTLPAQASASSSSTDLGSNQPSLPVAPTSDINQTDAVGKTRRLGPIFKLKSAKIGPNGPEYNVENIKSDYDTRLDNLVQNGKMTSQEADRLSEIMQSALDNGALNKDKTVHITHEKDARGQVFATYSIGDKNGKGESFTIPASPEGMLAVPAKEPKSGTWMVGPDGKPFVAPNTVGTQLPVGSQPLGRETTFDKQQKVADELSQYMTPQEATALGVNTRNASMWLSMKKANPNLDFYKIKQDAITDLKAAGTRGSQMTANYDAVAKTFNADLNEVIDLRKKVAAKNMIPTADLTPLEYINQLKGMKSSDPDVARFLTKVTLMADNLQKTIGGNAGGGEWAYSVAKDLLNPHYAPDAFEAVMRGHAKDISTIANARRNFGREWQDEVKYNTPPGPGQTVPQVSKSPSPLPANSTTSKPAFVPPPGSKIGKDAW